MSAVETFCDTMIQGLRDDDPNFHGGPYQVTVSGRLFTNYNDWSYRRWTIDYDTYAIELLEEDGKYHSANIHRKIRNSNSLNAGGTYDTAITYETLMLWGLEDHILKLKEVFYALEEYCSMPLPIEIWGLF